MTQIATVRKIPLDATFDHRDDGDDALAQALRRLNEELTYRSTHPESLPTVRYECTSWSSATDGP